MDYYPELRVKLFFGLQMAKPRFFFCGVWSFYLFITVSNS